MYVCTASDGKKTFQQRPCQGEVQQSTRSYKIRQTSADSQPKPVSLEGNEIYQQMKADNRRAEIKRELKRLYRDLDKAQANMDRELRVLRAKKSRANNNLAGAQWESSISAEMQAITTRYQVEMQRYQADITRLNAEMARL
ncbi:hypothetical protein GCM10011297_30670 [Bacterioplanes sanyensis]|nr:hypothetical protein GCM10011297_30670 [Bacterioplanes sanyensis]